MAFSEKETCMVNKLMLTFINKQGNVNQDQNEIPFYIHSIGKTKCDKTVEENLHQWDPLYINSGFANWTATLGNNLALPYPIEQSHTKKFHSQVFTQGKILPCTSETCDKDIADDTIDCVMFTQQ